MDRSQTLRVLDDSGWITQTKRYSAGTRRAARRGSWKPVTVTRSQHAVAADSSDCRVATGQDSRYPLFTVAPDTRWRAEGGPPRPLSRSNTKSDREFLLQTGLESKRVDDGRRWNEAMWKWLPLPRHPDSVVGGESSNPVPGEGVSHWVSEADLSSSSCNVDRTQEERNLDQVRSSLYQLQDHLSGDLLHQALSRMRKKLVSQGFPVPLPVIFVLRLYILPHLQGEKRLCRFQSLQRCNRSIKWTSTAVVSSTYMSLVLH